jgi:hypothetical protein
LEGIRHLKIYATREGHTRVPKRHVEAGYPLGAWVARTRARVAALSPEQRQALGGLPTWTWTASISQWDRNYQALIAYAKREGHAQVPGLHVEEAVELGRWVAR